MSKQTYMLMLLAFLLNLPAADSSLADEAEVYDALRCISVRSVKRTEVVNDLSILFFTKGKTVYLNILPKQCKGLSRDRRISYSSSVGRLCISDNIRILSDMGGASRKAEPADSDIFTTTKEGIQAAIDALYDPTEPAPVPPAEVEEISVETDEPLTGE